MKVCATATAHCWGCVVPLNGSGACKHLMGMPFFCLSTSVGGNGGECAMSIVWAGPVSDTWLSLTSRPKSYCGQDLLLILGCHRPSDPDLSRTIVGPQEGGLVAYTTFHQMLHGESL